MAIIKLVCQGCGANLDAQDNQRVFQCGYCGTANQIKQTVHEQRPASPPPPPSNQYQYPIHVPPGQVQTRARGIGTFVVIMTLLPLVIGGIIAFFAFQTTSDVMNQVKAGFGGNSTTAGTDARKYQWESNRPFLADVNGDGTQDIVGLIQEQGSQDIVMIAMSGADQTTLWETPIGSRADLPGQPKLRFEPSSQLAMFAVGASLTAYDAQTGAQRWVSNFPDAVQTVVHDGDHLWVGTLDGSGSEVSLADGKLSAGAEQPSETGVVVRDDGGYDLIPKLRTMDVESNAFSELRIEKGFCPEHELSVVGHRTFHCAHPHGLLYASRAKGTQVPFLVGYDPQSKTESWRVQLTTPGTLETVDSGFGQPRAELFGDAAVVSFVPKDNNARIRRISLVDGSTQWEVTLTQTRTENVEGIVVGEDSVLVNYGHEVHVFSLADGAEQAVLGGW